MTTRRQFIVIAAACAVPAAARAQIDPNLAQNRKAAFQEARRRIVGDAIVRPGRVKLTLPPLIDNPLALEVFADEATGFFHHNGNLSITFSSARVDHTSDPGPVSRVVVGRLVLPVSGAFSPH